MIYKVEKFIAKHSLLKQGDKVLVALSGGADSVALLIALLKLGYRCEAIHCNFHLRGEESNRDETFTHNLCERLGITLHITHFNTAEYATQNGIPARWYYINISSAQIVNQIKSLIARDILGSQSFYHIYNTQDNCVQKAISELKNGNAQFPIMPTDTIK